MKNTLVLTKMLFSLFSSVSVFLFSACLNSNPQAATLIEDDFKLEKVQDSQQVKEGEILTFLCEIIISKPDSATPNCADFGEAIFKISWVTWSAKGAAGIGTHSINDCNPDCTSGSITKTKVKVRLENLYTDGTRFFLRDLTFTSVVKGVDGNYLTGGWDTADFYLNVPEMRSDG